jgi:hypothetical protein
MPPAALASCWGPHAFAVGSGGGPRGRVGASDRVTVGDSGLSLGITALASGLVGG